MSRVINPETAGKQRKLLLRNVVVAIRELMKQESQDDLSRDLAAFVGLLLLEIYETVNVSVDAWEKRNYWVKADRYRMDWVWSEQLGHQMCKAVLADDWLTVAFTSAKIAQQVSSVELPKRLNLGEPWVGSWEKLFDDYS